MNISRKKENEANRVVKKLFSNEHDRTYSVLIPLLLELCALLNTSPKKVLRSHSESAIRDALSIALKLTDRFYNEKTLPPYVYANVILGQLIRKTELPKILPPRPWWERAYFALTTF